MLTKAKSPRGNLIKMSSEYLPSRESHYLYHGCYLIPPRFCMPAVILSGPKRNAFCIPRPHLQYIQLMYLIYKSVLT